MPKLLAAAACACLFGVVGTARADGLDSVRARGEIVWGGDQEGGGPYVYPDPNKPSQVTGFEVDLMNSLAKRLGVQARFRQCEWTSLPLLLSRGDIDTIVNGYELTKPRLASMIATVPYYVYELQLIARRDNDSIHSWDDLKTPGPAGKRRIGVMPGTAAETYVRHTLGDAVELRNSYSGTTDALQDVTNGRLDATVQDLPAAIFYRKSYAQLHFVGQPVGRGYYVVYLRPGEERLRDALNDGVRALLKNGQLQAIYERYGLWNRTQEDLQRTVNEAPEQLVSGGEEEPSFAAKLTLLLQAAGLTVVLSLLAMPLAIATGLTIALGRLYGPMPLRPLLTAYVEILRGTPLLFQLFVLYYTLPMMPGIHLRLPALWAAVVGLAMNYSAYESEIYRTGLLAIPVGQMEAALSLGMSRATALWRIIIPQAVRLVVPPVTNDFIALFKDTSLCSTITLVELTKEYYILTNSYRGYGQIALVTAALYLLMSYPLSLLARRLERRSPKVVM
ncbi:MAG TPA: ABC transporter substrate-binding protein/permease [Gemmataceae bacterium]|nr:ABC transporter substrate-binding protein/permease [Gemmataceae bacterium]